MTTETSTSTKPTSNQKFQYRLLQHHETDDGSVGGMHQVWFLYEALRIDICNKLRNSRAFSALVTVC